MKRMLLIDSSALLFRAYYAVVGAGVNSEEALHIYSSWLKNFLDKYNPKYAISAIDLHNKKSENFNLNPDYKSNRTSLPSDLIELFPKFSIEAKKLGYSIKGVEGNEADDVIGSIVHKYSDNVDETIVVSTDKDLLQLVDDDKNIYVISLKQGAKQKIWHEVDVDEKFKIKEPIQVAFHKALAGDPSDNYKGVPGIGSGLASELDRRYGTLDNLYKAIDSGLYTRKGLKLLMRNRDVAYKTYKLAKLNDELPIGELSAFERQNND